MKTDRQPNNELHFPELENGKTIPLFHCDKCGFHPHVFVNGYQANNSHLIYSRYESIYPRYTKINETICHCVLNSDEEIIEIITCMKCGESGKMVQVPEAFLKSCGLLDKIPDCITVRNDSKPVFWVKRTVRSLLQFLRLRK